MSGFTVGSVIDPVTFTGILSGVLPAVFKVSARSARSTVFAGRLALPCPVIFNTGEAMVMSWVAAIPAAMSADMLSAVNLVRLVLGAFDNWCLPISASAWASAYP